MPRPAAADVRRLTSLAAAFLLAGCLPDEVVAPPPSVDEATTARSSAALADAAGRIIYAANVSFTPEHGSTGAVAMSVRPDGSGARPLLAPGRQPWTFVGSLAFSPTRDRILFHGDGTFHVLHRDGSIVAVGHDSLNVNEPRWSPDGRWIVGTQFWPAVGARRGTVWLMAADGSSTTRYPIGTSSEAMFTPDGLLAVQGDLAAGEMWWEHADLDGRVVRRVDGRTQNSLRKLLEDTSPDGRLRAAVSPRSGIYLTNTVTGDSTLVLARAGISYRVRWSPDGRHLAALADCHASGLWPGELLVVAADGSGARTVARDVFCRGGFDW